MRALELAMLALALPACEGLILLGAALPRLRPRAHTMPHRGCAVGGFGTAGARRGARGCGAAHGNLALRCQQQEAGQAEVEVWRQGSIKGPDPLAPYCTETVATPTGTHTEKSHV
jgi:hypothetical protein